MKVAMTNNKSAQSDGPKGWAASGAGRDGASAEPPAYGVDFIDRARGSGGGLSAVRDRSCSACDAGRNSMGASADKGGAASPAEGAKAKEAGFPMRSITLNPVLFPGTTKGFVAEQVKTANRLFEPYGTTLKTGSIKEVPQDEADASGLFDKNGHLDTYGSLFDKPEVIKMYRQYVPVGDNFFGVVKRFTEDGVAGLANLAKGSSSGPDGMFFVSEEIGRPTVTAHEIGHAFYGWEHPHDELGGRDEDVDDLMSWNRIEDRIKLTDKQIESIGFGPVHRPLGMKRDELREDELKEGERYKEMPLPSHPLLKRGLIVKGSGNDESCTAFLAHPVGAARLQTKRVDLPLESNEIAVRISGDSELYHKFVYKKQEKRGGELHTDSAGVLGLDEWKFHRLDFSVKKTPFPLKDGEGAFFYGVAPIVGINRDTGRSGPDENYMVYAEGAGPTGGNAVPAIIDSELKREELGQDTVELVMKNGVIEAFVLYRHGAKVKELPYEWPSEFLSNGGRLT